MSKIEWTEATWNPIVGCSRVRRGDRPSGCDHCYAEGQMHRFGQPKKDAHGNVLAPSKYDRPTTIKLGASKREGLTYLPTVDGKSIGKGGRWTGAVWLLPDVLAEPLKRRKPTTYFVNSLADAFHESIVDSEDGRRFLAAMFGVMAACPQHRFQILTKRPEKAREWFAWLDASASEHMTDVFPDAVIEACIMAANDHLHAVGEGGAAELLMDRWTWSTQGEYGFEAESHDDVRRVNRLVERMRAGPQIDEEEWPRRNIWIGASVEDQPSADERIPALLELPAAVRFLSCEPLLGLTDVSRWLVSRDAENDAGPPRHATIDWVICGGESGHGARPLHPDWARSLRDQCVEAGTKFFFKQWGEFAPVYDYDPGWTHVVGIDGKAFKRGEEMPMCFAGAPDLAYMARDGKKAAGRSLDGRTWDEMPERGR